MGLITRILRSLFPRRNIGLTQERGFRGAAVCTIFRDHKWHSEPGSPFKRKCTTCGAEEWLFENRYPAIGEPKYEWVDMTPTKFKHL